MQWKKEKMITGIIKSPVPTIASGMIPVLALSYITCTRYYDILIYRRKPNEVSAIDR